MLVVRLLPILSSLLISLSNSRVSSITSEVRAGSELAADSDQTPLSNWDSGALNMSFIKWFYLSFVHWAPRIVLHVQDGLPCDRRSVTGELCPIWAVFQDVLYRFHAQTMWEAHWQKYVEVFLENNKLEDVYLVQHEHAGCRWDLWEGHAGHTVESLEAVGRRRGCGPGPHSVHRNTATPPHWLSTRAPHGRVRCWELVGFHLNTKSLLARTGAQSQSQPCPQSLFLLRYDLRERETPIDLKYN